MNKEEFAELISLYPEYANHFMWMSPSKNGTKGYFRRIPKWYKNPEARSAASLRLEIAVGKTAYKNYGKKGYDEKGMPIIASICGKELKGKKFKEPNRVIADAIKKLRESLKEVGKVVEV